MHMTLTNWHKQLSLASAFAALLCLGMSACGSSTPLAAQRPSVADAPASHREYLNDGDEDPSSDRDADDFNGKTKDQDKDYPADHLETENGSYHDGDDSQIIAFGHRADRSDETHIRTLAERYYQAAASGDGTTGCSLLAAWFAKSIPADYGKSPGPEYLRGITCPVVLGKIFEHSHDQLTERFSVTQARVEGSHGIALLGSETKPASYITLERTASGWQVVDQLPIALP